MDIANGSHMHIGLLYFSDYTMSSTVGKFDFPILNFFAYNLVYLSGPFAVFSPDEPQPQILVGLIYSTISLTGIGALVVNSFYLIWKTRQVTNIRVWWLIASIAFGSSLFTALRRTQLGILQAAESRYATISNLMWISIIMLSLITIFYLYQNRRTSLFEKWIYWTNISGMTILTVVFVCITAYAVIAMPQFLVTGRWNSNCVLS